MAILLGGTWTIWRYLLQREGNAKIQFNVDLKVVGVLKDSYIVEVIAIVENKGSVRLYVDDFKFDLLYLSDKHELIDGDARINFQAAIIGISFPANLKAADTFAEKLQAAPEALEERKSIGKLGDIVW